MRDTRMNRRYVLVYTAAFALLALAVFFPFLRAGKSLVGNGDGQSQYILQLRYMGEWLRESADNLLHGRFFLRTYDYTIGMGDDINAIVRFHPLDYLSIFVPAKHTETLYDFLILLRMYLAGLAFSLYAFYWKKSGAKVLAGAVTYLFCGYVFELGIVHPVYLAPMIVLPLLLLGAEYMMEQGRKHSFALFTVMVYLGFTSNYYFMYINSVALLIYVLIRFFVLHPKGRRVREFFSLLVRMVSAYLVGLLLSFVTLLPTLNRYFNSYRSANLSESGNLLYYEDARRYFAWAINLISPLEASGNGTHLNFTVTVLPAIVLIFAAGYGKWKSLKRILLALLLFLLLPAGGFIMAVMHTENNRWVYLISLAAAVCVTFAAGHFFEQHVTQRRALIAVTVLFDVAVAILTALYPVSVFHLLAAAELTVFTLLVCLIPARFPGGEGGISSAGFVLVFTAVSAVLNGYFTFGGRFGNLTRYYADAGTTQSFFSDSEYANYALAAGSGQKGKDVWKDGFYRVDGIWDGSGEDNAALQLGYPGVQIYNSVLNAAQIRYLMDLENIGLTTMLHIHSLDGRSGAEALAGVRYFQTRVNQSAQLPYGFDRQVWMDGKMAVWENESPLAFGYTSDLVLPCSAMEDLSGDKIEELMLSAVVLEDDDVLKLMPENAPSGNAGEKEEAVLAAETEDIASGKTEPDEVPSKDTDPGSALHLADKEALLSGILSCEIPLPEGTKGIERTPDGYRVKKRRATLQIPYLRKAGCDVLIRFEGLKPDGIGASMKVTAPGISKRVHLLSDEQTYTLNREDYLVSLGYAPKDREDLVEIRFTKKGFYHLEGIRVINVARGDFAEKIRALNENSLQDVSFGPDIITGSIRLQDPRVMVFQIPWSRGWSARVDGQEASLLQANECYTGLCLDSGEHEIVLFYRTPWGREGALLSLAGLVLFVTGYALVCRRRRRH